MMHTSERINPMNAHAQSIYILSSLLFCSASLARADFEPLPLTPASFNQDVVVEQTAPPPVVPVTTASMEQGLANAGFTWFERGYIADWPSTGLPRAGSLLTSLKSADHQYQMPSSYRQANAVLIDRAQPTATIVFIAPTNCAALSVLTSSGAAPNVLQYTVHYASQGSESGVFTSPNWYSIYEPAWAASGRVDVNTFIHADLTAYNPRLYSVDLLLTNVLGPITQLDLSLLSGSGHTAIFAISGALKPGDPFQPLSISGFNADLVVEASALQPGFLATNTTATFENGAANTRFTWFEQGYYPPAPGCGLPAAQSVVVSESDPRHRFVLPPSYLENNAVLLDAASLEATLALQAPASCSALSFLTASSHGPLTNRCAVGHADGTFETNSFVSPDWLGSAPPALTTHGRVSVSTRLTDRIGSSGPCLFAADVPLHSTNSPVSTILLSSPVATGGSARALVFAVSGAVPDAPILPASLSIEATPDGQLTIHSTRPGALQSCSNLLGPDTVWKNEGPIQQSFTLTPSSTDPARFYRVISQ